MSEGKPGGGDGKTLLPELLPAPAPLAAATPRERVAARTRLLLARFRDLKITASAAMLSLECTGNVGGKYGVVDPIPPPAQQCGTITDPIAQISAIAYIDVARAPRPPFDSGPPPPPPVVLKLSGGQSTSYIGYRLDAVRVSGGTAIDVQDDKANGSGFSVAIVPETATSVILVDLDFGCGAVTGTKHYRILYRLPPAQPLLEELTAALDAGAD